MIAGDASDLAQRTTARASASPSPEFLASERIRILHEYYRRGAEDSEFFARAPTVTYRGSGVRIVSHIVP
jgi:hypothetical protein